MPRIPPRCFRLARSIDQHVFRLLPACREIRSATNEVRWLKEHAQAKCFNKYDQYYRFAQYVKRRALGEPLQYILGSAYFGPLEIRCRKGVLIPRQETAASVSFLVQLLSQGNDTTPALKKVRLLDVCTGSGCIPLLFHYDFYKVAGNDNIDLDLVGIDISQTALQLSRENRSARLQELSNSAPASLRALESMRFVQADVLKHDISIEHSGPRKASLERILDARQHPSVSGPFDILISNPPYISTADFMTTTSRSVRRYEPRLALVPPTINEGSPDPQSRYDGDLFYPCLLSIAESVNAKVILFEVGDLEQAIRVASEVIRQSTWSVVEIWRDDPSSSQKTEIDLSGQRVVVRGQGHGRSVFAYRGDAVEWVS